MVECFDGVKQPTDFKPINGIVKDETLLQGAWLIICLLSYGEKLNLYLHEFINHDVDLVWLLWQLFSVI